MGLDDECFAQFYERYIVGGRISYMEKHLANASETFSTLRSFEGQYSLVTHKPMGKRKLLIGLWELCLGQF